MKQQGGTLVRNCLLTLDKLEELVSQVLNYDPHVWKLILEEQLRGYESQFGFSTREMVYRVSSGVLDHHGEIGEWLMISRRYERILEDL